MPGTSRLANDGSSSCNFFRLMTRSALAGPAHFLLSPRRKWAGPARLLKGVEDCVEVVTLDYARVGPEVEVSSLLFMLMQIYLFRLWMMGVRLIKQEIRVTWSDRPTSVKNK